MKLTKNKKSIELTLSTIGIAILVLVVLFVLLYTFTNIFGKQRGQINEQIGALDDYDQDGTANMFDKCPCDSEPPEDGKCKTTKDACKDKMKEHYSKK